MIWFSCTKCGKAIGRPESSAGAVVFCDCGQGIVVPWDSTIAGPAEPPPVAGPVPQPPPLRVVPMGEEQIPVVRKAPSSPGQNDTAAAGRDAAAPRDPKACFNHQDRPGQEKCVDCGENFCNDCLVKFKGATLCGPCKNFRLHQTNRPSTTSNKAVFGVILALCCAPVLMCLVPLGTNAFTVFVCAVALLGQITATLLGILALRETEKNPRLAGRSLAITTVVTAGLATLMTVCFLLVG
jgi:hypothetical protein